MNLLEINGEKSYFYYQENILDKDELIMLQKWLDTKQYKKGSLLNGREIFREQLWFQDDKSYFCNTWKYKYDRWVSQEKDQIIQNMQKKISILTNEIFKKYNLDPTNYNSCLINKYRDGNDYIKPHSDSYDSFGMYPTIAGLSIGDTRVINFKQKKNVSKENREFNFTLNNNSLFIMAGSSQKHFTHEIKKNNSSKTRYSLTFRKYVG